MELTVLGCSGSGPGPGSPSSGYLLRVGGAAVALDLGSGALGELQRHLDPFELDAVLLSHLHQDHCVDVGSLAVYLRYHPRPPSDRSSRRLPVYGPAGTDDRLAAIYGASAAERAETDLGDVFEFHPIASRSRVAGADLGAARVAHACESYALRLEFAGRSLVYSGDTGPCDALVELARDADVLLCEASWPHLDENGRPHPPGLHLSGRQAGEHAAEAGARRLLITHVPVWYDAAALLAEARQAYGGPADLVRVGAGYTI